jgi:putative transcriptional regulator
MRSVAPMIRWRLRQVMADRQISNRALAEALGVHEASVSNMKRRDTMPRIDGTQLDALCRALNCTPAELIDYSGNSLP